ADRGWAIKPDGDGWRRVVASPEPRAIVELKPIRTLVDAGYLVVCVGGGGIPVVTQGPRQVGVEAVVDKDLSSALLAAELGADLLVLATDVTCVSTGWGSPHEQAITQTTPGWLRARTFAAGSMAPKVDAVCRFVEETGKRAAIGRLADLTGLLEGTAGTQIASVPPWLSVSADDALADLAQPSSR
ncbi:MAG: carbamate kinase, partial [Microbacteriaceae bacterium]|nr:carbamate kinase [Microbacteriaceae bacterium]